MNRGSQAVVLVLLGGAILRASLTDLYLRYVKQGLRPFLIAAGAVLVVAAVVALVQELRHLNRADDAGDGADDGHGHGRSGPAVGWLLLLPALALLFLVPPALGADTASRAGSALTEDRDVAYPPLPPREPAELTLLEYGYRAVYDDGRTLRGRQLQLTGFLAPGPEGRPMLARIVLSCCAADGVPIKVGLRGEVPALPADTWIRATGRWIPHTVKDPVNDADVPSFQVDTWERIAAPAEPYE
ncbi:TIGR03943 family protein [Micromonospora sp. WMMA2032]|uniref:TIGR03943 family putative permease subunit n=1 Tax=Micromonospora sp. WMMA2032 TaxID=2039870 RepID=UPI000C05B881|nr:TIGR03943 family protein [Micromonospora sp. WMMA2032]ATO12677.1 TIGR03943 family protein [Micromonospora sp. WMMA2032]